MLKYRRIQKCFPNTVIVIVDDSHSCYCCLDKASRLRHKLNHVVPKPQKLDVPCPVYGSEFCTRKKFGTLFPETAQSQIAGPKKPTGCPSPITGLLQLVDESLKGSFLQGIALCRPPGHHAGPRSSTGFCLINNVALAARYAMNRHPAQHL